MVKKVKIFPAPHVEVRIHVSDGMEQAMKGCTESAKKTRNGCDCSKCPWDEVDVFGTGMCELEEVRKKILGGERWGD